VLRQVPAGIGQTHELKDNEQDIVRDKRPLAAISIRSNSENDGADRTEHQHEGHPPCNISSAAAKGFAQVFDGKRDGEEVESVPGLLV
jgi:hypothetical protein